jgi:hypothetical protein
MNTLYFAKSMNGLIPRGSILSLEPTASNQTPIIAKEFEVFTHKDQNYLLTEKEPLEFTGSLQTPQGNEIYFQKSNITYRYNQDLELQEVSPNWLKEGIKTNKGIVLELGDEIAICKNGEGAKSYFKKSLLPIESEREILDQELKALEYRGRLYKSLAGVTPGIKQGAPRWNVSFKGQKAQIVPSQEHTEGEIRQFSANDTRQLTRAKSGLLRWVSVDEKVKLQQAKQKAQIEESKGKERKKYEEGTKEPGLLKKLFRIGKELFIRGEKATVIDYGDDIIAVKKQDGKTTTIRASEYNPEHHESTRNPVPTSTEESPEETRRKEMKSRSTQRILDTDLHEETPRNKYYDEQQAIIKEQSELPEYQKFQKEQEKNGWTKDIATPFRFVKDISFVSSLGNLRSGTAEKVWRPEKKDYDYYFEGQGFDAVYQGKQYKIIGMNDKDIEIRDQFGNKQTIKNDELDQYKGQIILDAEGNARVINAQGEEFPLELNEGLTQEDLFKEGTVKIIRDEVWKSIKNGEGAVIDDIKLGKIRNGIAFYKHGDEAGIVDENRHQYQVGQKDVKRDLPEPSDKLKEFQKEVKKEKEKLDKKNLERQDVETVKARVQHGNQNIPYAQKGKDLEPEKYQDVFNQWITDGGTGIDEQIAGSYSNPDEWKANVLSLAERMKVEDVKRASEVTALNDFAKTGVIIEPPKPREMNEYIETAKDILMSRRKEFLQKKKSERIEAEREGEIPAKFDWDETAELPSAETGAIVSDNVKIIRDSRNESYQVQYAFVPKQSVMVSHSIEGETNTEHPSELQAREREKDISSSLQMREIANNPNEELVEDNKDATRGAPVAYTKNGKTYIVQGNGRAGAVQGMEGAGKEKYFGMMLQKAKELGIPTDKVNDDMMLVRVLSPVHTYEDARKLGAFGQKSSALPMTEVEEARTYQNAHREMFKFKDLNLKGIGRRSITEKNIGTFIRNNPKLYEQMARLGSFDPVTIQNRPAEQAKVVNTAFLAQLNKDFIRTVSRKGEDTHELAKVTAPIIAENQNDIADGTVPPNGNIQKFLQNSIEQYDSLSSATKNLLKVDKNGSIPFLETGEEGRKNPDSLISRMRQETIEFGDKKSGNIFRNPLNVIGLVAYHQAMTPRDPEKKDQARELFALKMKRFADAMKTLKENKQQGGDIFAAQLSESELAAQQQEDIIKIAERVFLENKPYREENAEEMTAEEKEAGKETYSAFNAYKKMKDVAKEFEFSLEHHKLQKSLLGYFFKSLIQKHHEEIKKFKTDQMDMFGAPKPQQQSGQLSWKSLGQEKPNHKYIRRERGKSGEWVYWYKDEQGKEFKADQKGNPLPKHHDWQEGDTVIHDSKKYKLGQFGDNVAMIEDQSGQKKVVRIAELTHEAEHQKELVKQHETKWDRLVAALEQDLENGSEKNEYQYADSKLELQRKIKYAHEERDKRKGQQEKKVEIPEFHTTQDAIAFGDKATPEQVEELKRLREETLKEGYKQKDAKNMQEAMDLAVKAQLYREAVEANEKKEGSSVSTLREKSLSTEDHSATEPASSGRSEAGSTPKDQTETPEFKKWFGDSKVVDKDGKPKVVYHGTNKDFGEFSESKFGRSTKHLTAKVGFFFSSMPDIAEEFTKDINDKPAKNANIMPVYLNIKNPFEMDVNDYYNRYIIGQKNFLELVSNIKRNNYDGIKIIGDDKFIDEQKEFSADTYVIFSPSQIKSAIGNKGTFNPESADITKSIKYFFKQLIQARKGTDTNPTEAQKKARNYAKGIIEIHGLEIAIENPKGSYRTGIDKDGKEWKILMPADYGYFKTKDANGVQVKGKDKEEIDCFIGNDPKSDQIFIVNQIIKDTKKFDEHKVLIAFPNRDKAFKAYKNGYSDDARKRIGSIVEMNIDEFKEWLKNDSHQLEAEDNNGKASEKERIMKSIEAKKPEPPIIKDAESIKEIVKQVISEQKSSATEVKEGIISEIRAIEEAKKQAVPTKWVFKVTRDLAGFIQEIVAEKK